MLYIAILLHIYQPSTQFPEITSDITNTSYRLLLKILEKTKAKVVLNINASLTEQLARLGGEDVIRSIVGLAQKNQIEFTGSAAYHPLLSRLPADLIIRQIQLNTEINQKYFGKIYCPDGFFPPEMAYSNRVGEVLKDLNFDWVILDEHGYPGGVNKIRHDVIYVKQPQTVILGSEATPESDSGQARMTTRKPLNIFFRNDDLSLGIAFSQIKTLNDFKRIIGVIARKNFSPSLRGVSETNDEAIYSPKDKIATATSWPRNDTSMNVDTDSYIIIALDGETFGHHQPGQEKLLTDILSYNKINKVTISELKKYFQKEVLIKPLTSCWGVSNEDMQKKIYWPRWSYPGNPIHELQWELTRLAIKSQQKRHSGEPERRLQNRFWTGQNDGPTLFDKALQSDQYWWASHKPYWHPEMIRRGAEMLKNVIRQNPQNSAKIKKKAQKLYYDIVETGQRLYGKQIITSSDN